ncbi:MAG: hypothetical protein NTY13_00975 [Chlamydiae bacterium]|nr:hypothetical protein [Chlamydiota bacterium]
MGIYPMLLNEICFFLAADFDKSSWEEDARAFLKTCQELNLPAALERSLSGKGAHVWLFFAEAIPAILARKLGCHILTETMEHRPDVGLGSYDRFFPNPRYAASRRIWESHRSTPTKKRLEISAIACL